MAAKIQHHKALGDSGSVPDKLFQVLVIEDNVGDAVLLKTTLRKSFRGTKLHIVHAQTLTEALNVLKTRHFDLITVDLHLPDSLELDSVVATRKAAPLVPMIVVTGWSDREAARTALRLGAQDYIIKGSFNPQTLRWNIESAVERQQNYNRMEELRRSEVEKNQTKDQVLSMTAHDIRGPLIGVLSYLNNILKGEFLEGMSPDQKRVFELMHSNCEQVLSLADDIVQARKKNLEIFSIQTEFIHLQSFLEKIVEEFEVRAQSKEIALKLDFANAPRSFHFDPNLIKRALSNLLSNAIAYSPDRSIVQVVAQRGSNGLQIWICDEGPGIDEEKIGELFEERRTLMPEEQKELSPKGLGLVIVRRICESHGGSVWVETRKAFGSKFVIELPELDLSREYSRS